MSNEQPPDDSLPQIVPAEPLEHVSPAEPCLEEFKPWHLPRKQHVRKRQWGDALGHLIDELPSQPMINYLCLPGEDLLDVQVLAAVCREKRRRLRYLGFDSLRAGGLRSIQRVAAEQILRQTEVVDDTSEVVPDVFASIASDNSVGRRRLRKCGSYDVVNLDMCYAFTTTTGAHNHDAVLELLNHQCHSRGEPWLLFLTTRAEADRFQAKELEVYDNRIRENMQRSAEFCECVARMLGIAAGLTPEALVAGMRERRANDTGIAGRWLTLGIGKWLLGIMGAKSPWRVDLLSVCCYRTGLLSMNAKKRAAEPPNLFSLAFRLEKIRQPRLDPAELASSTFPSGKFNETGLAQKMAGCLENHTLDLDHHLQSNAEENKNLSEECAAMLSVRYYSAGAYRTWAGKLPRITFVPPRAAS